MKATITLEIDTSTEPRLSTNDAIRWLYDFIGYAAEDAEPSIKIEDVSIEKDSE